MSDQDELRDYTPDRGTVRYRYVDGDYSGGNRDPHAEFDRFIAKVKADALREASMKLCDGVGTCNIGCHASDMMTLKMLADRIEVET